MKSILTEREWLASAEPNVLVRHVKDRFGVRELLLIRAGCCYPLWDRLVDEQSRRSVLVAERVADGLATVDELRRAYREAQEAYVELHTRLWQADRPAVHAAFFAVRCGSLESAPWQEAVNFFNFFGGGRANTKLTRRQQAEIVRDVVGNPFRPARLDPGCRGEAGSAVRQIAGAIYEDRTFAHLPVLADALEDAGCTDRQPLDHCRGGGLHVRGCWVVDLVLGKREPAAA